MPFTVPYAPSQIYVPNGRLVDLIRAQGEDAARSAELRGQMAAQTWSGIGNAIQGGIGRILQANDPRRKLEDLQLQDALDRRKGNAAVDTMMRGDQLPVGDVGPRQEGYLTTEGLFDVPKLNQALSGMGLAHMAPDLLKGAESINDSITKHQQLEQQLASQHTIMLGDMADGALRLTKAGAPLLNAMDLVAQPAIATKRIQPQEYAQVRSQIAALPPEQQQAALGAFMDAAAKLDKGENLAEGAKHVDRYGRDVASGTKKPPTAAELAFDLSNEDPAVRARAKTAIDALHPPPKRTDTEMALDAYARFIGKQKAEDLTYGERQTFEKDKATITSNQAYQQHMRERQYDIANPVPEKAASQDKLEQEYRTVLARGMSSRSGGLGLEDAKVQQANHLMTIFEQNYDAKSGEWHIPRVQLNELALGLAKLTVPGGQAGVEMLKGFQQRTAKGDIAGALSYITGLPIAANTQAITQMLKESIERQGRTAETNREGEMAYLRGLAPTGLDEPRRLKLEATSLNPLRQSRIAVNDKGERRLFVSTDGGKTWK